MIVLDLGKLIIKSCAERIHKIKCKDCCFSFSVKVHMKMNVDLIIKVIQKRLKKT